jgi:SAM-dependent methyltransferase
LGCTRTGLAWLREVGRRAGRSVRRRGLKGTAALAARKAGDLLGDWLLPSRYRARRQDREFDARFGVETSGVVGLERLQIESPNRRHGVWHEQSRPAAFHGLLKRLPIRHEEFVFVDFGSGKGRALLMASEYPFKRLVGVEFARELHEAARENVRRYRSATQRCRQFELHCLDAVEYEVPREPTVFYFYNPFDAVVLAQVLDNIRRSLAECPREVFVVYLNSLHGEQVRRAGFREISRGRWHAVYRAGREKERVGERT